MGFIKFYFKLAKKPIPYYANHSIIFLFWKMIRKYINVVLIPNNPFNFMRILLYRLVGFKIGKNVFIGMKCYLDDLEPEKTIIEDNVIMSYGCYFAIHGKSQANTTITIKKHAYIGMSCNILGGKKGIEIGEYSVIGAGTLVNKSIPPYAVAVGVPVKVIKFIKK